MTINPNRLRITTIFCLFFVNLISLAQIQIVSPYSRYGVGKLAENKNAWNNSMGQLGFALSSPYHVNFSNPASYAAFDSLSFLFEGGFNGDFTTLTSNVQTSNGSYGSLAYLLFGMPVYKWWKTSLGLVPYSDVGYSVVNREEYQYTGTVQRTYSGSGGLNRLYWGNAFRPIKNLSVGINISYMFGSMDRAAKVTFPDSIYAMNFREIFYVTMSDFYYDFGAQYTTKIKNDLFLNVGAVFAPSMSMASKTDILATTFLKNDAGAESTRDTLLNEEGYAGRIKIPMMVGGGFAFNKTDKWLVGVDYKWQNWEKYNAFGLGDSLVNSWQVNAGGEITPNSNNFNNYLARVRYRLGFSYGKTYLQLRGLDLNEYSLSFGFGFPLRGMKTQLNLGGQYGVMGTTEQGLIKESYFRVIIGFSLYDRWFVKRKYY
jgi:hypothetical protein